MFVFSQGEGGLSSEGTQPPPSLGGGQGGIPSIILLVPLLQPPFGS